MFKEMTTKNVHNQWHQATDFKLLKKIKNKKSKQYKY